MIRRFLMPMLLWATVSPACAGLLQHPLMSGQFKSTNLGYHEAPELSLQGGTFSANSLRLGLKGNLSRSTELEFALDGLLLYTDRPQLLPLSDAPPPRKLNLTQDWNRGEVWSGRLTVDRFALKGSAADIDWSVGRQAIGFGRIVMFSPLDCVTPFAPDALDTDIRPGVDALRAVHYFGLGGQVGGTIVLGETADHNSYLLTLSTNRSGIDLLGIGGMLRERELFGMGLAGNIGALGIKGEITHYQGKDVDLPGGDLQDDFSIGAVEFWYRFANGLTLISEYFYNGAGVTHPVDYPAQAASATFREGLSPLLGRHYLLLGPSWEVHPLVILSALLIWNLDDESTLLRPQVQLSLADNLSLELFYNLNFGPKSQPLTPAVAIPQSEFGSVADSGGLLLRWYF